MALYSNELPLQCINRPPPPVVPTILTSLNDYIENVSGGSVDMIVTGSGFSTVGGNARMYATWQGGSANSVQYPCVVDSDTQMRFSWSVPSYGHGDYEMWARVTGNNPESSVNKPIFTWANS